MKQYELVLRNEKIGYYNVLGWIIIICSVVGLIIDVAVNKFQKPIPVLLAAVALLSIFILRYFKESKKIPSLLPAYGVLAVAWIFSGHEIISLFLIVFGILHAIAIRSFIVEISADLVIFPSFPKKKIKWNELSQLILKDGLLTIDFKNNQLIQQLVDETKTSLEEKEFNEYCRQQLNK
jgi:hypothetical protein